MKQKLFDPRVWVAFFILMIFIIPVVITNFVKNPSTPKIVIITNTPAMFTSTFADANSTTTDIDVTQTKAFTATLITQTTEVASTNTTTVTSTVLPLTRTVPSVPVVSPTTSPVQETSITNTVPPSAPVTVTESPTSPSSSTQISLIQSFPAPGSRAEGITWDGTFLWITDNSATIFKIDTSGNVLESSQSPEGTPQGITWDGASFWVYTTNRSRIYQLQLSGGQTQIINYFVAPTQVIGGGITQDMAWDSGGLWYANQFKVYKLDTSGNTLSSFTYGKNVTGLDWDGSNLWLAYNDFPANATLSIVNTSGQTIETYSSPIFQINSLVWADGFLWALGLDSLGGNPKIYKLGISN